MNKEELFGSMCAELKDKLIFLKDKPEETPETTLKALWFAATGFSVSAEGAGNLAIPDLMEQQVVHLRHLIELRLQNTPLAHITRRQNFMGIELISDTRALIPRKETEILGRKALELSMKIAELKPSINVIDVCCGSGNLGIALAYFNQKCIVHATDISPEAIELTQDNINMMHLNHRVKAKQGDVLSAFESDGFHLSIDLIVCNPPYILSSNVQKMATEISLNEPVLAFDGGMLGIKIIKRLIHESYHFLASDGWLIFEVGAGQGKLIYQLCERTQLYQQIESVTDDAGVIRVIKAQKKPIE